MINITELSEIIGFIAELDKIKQSISIYDDLSMTDEIYEDIAKLRIEMEQYLAIAEERLRDSISEAQR